MRRHLAKLLRGKHTPYLEFRHDHLPPLKAAAAEAMEAAEQELQATAAAAAASAAATAGLDAAGSDVDGGSSSIDNDSELEGGSSFAQDDIDAAIKRLQAATRQKVRN